MKLNKVLYSGIVFLTSDGSYLHHGDTSLSQNSFLPRYFASQQRVGESMRSQQRVPKAQGGTRGLILPLVKGVRGISNEFCLSIDISDHF